VEEEEEEGWFGLLSFPLIPPLPLRRFFSWYYHYNYYFLLPFTILLRHDRSFWIFYRDGWEVIGWSVVNRDMFVPFFYMYRNAQIS